MRSAKTLPESTDPFADNATCIAYGIAPSSRQQTEHLFVMQATWA